MHRSSLTERFAGVDLVGIQLRGHLQPVGQAVWSLIREASMFHLDLSRPGQTSCRPVPYIGASQAVKIQQRTTRPPKISNQPLGLQVHEPRIAR
jgi:hypothetical protein